MKSSQDKGSINPGCRNNRNSWRSLAIFVLFLLFLFGLNRVVATANQTVESDSQSPENVRAELVKLGTFGSLDGVTGISFDQAGVCVLQNDISHVKIPFEVLNGGWDEVKAMWYSAFNHRVLCYRFEQDQLQTESGNVLYPADAPERFVAGKLMVLKKFAQDYYAKTGCYPNDARKWNSEEELNYKNPFSGSPDSPRSKTLNGTLDRDYIFPGLETSFEPAGVDMVAYLSGGGAWRDYQSPRAGGIAALSLFKAQRCADGFKVTEFYARGYDRNARILSAGRPGATLLVALNTGKDLLQESSDRSEDRVESNAQRPARVFISVNKSVNLYLLQNGMVIAFQLVAIACLVGWFFLEFPQRLVDHRRFPGRLEMVFAISTILWISSAIIHGHP